MMVRLRDVQASDLPLIRSWARDEQYKEFFRRCPPENTWPDNTLGWWNTSFIICEEDKPVGVAMLANFDTQNRRAEYGVLIDRQLTCRRDVAKQAGNILADYLFDYLGYEKATVLVLPHRESLIKFMEASGFIVEGNLRRNLFWNGAWHDEVIMGCVKGEYK